MFSYSIVYKRMKLEGKYELTNQNRSGRHSKMSRQNY